MMARGRMIDRRISNSKKLGIVNDRARVMWAWLYVYTDKEGRVKFDDLEDLIQDCIPRFKDYSIDSVVKAIEDLDKIDLLILYPYKNPLHPMAFAIQFERFRDFQTIRENREGESRVPPPPEHARITPGVEREHYSFTPLLSLSLSKLKEGSKEGPGVLQDYSGSKEENTHNLIKFKQSIYKELLQANGIGEDKAKKLSNFIIDELMVEFPEVDAIEQVKKKCTWWRDHPISKKSNLHSQMRNWFKKAQQFLNEAETERHVGRSQKPKPKTDWQKDLNLLLLKAEKKTLEKHPELKGEELEQKVKKARGKASQEFWEKRK